MSEQPTTTTEDQPTLTQASSSNGLKRRASSDASTGDDAISRKRLKEDDTRDEEEIVASSLKVMGSLLAVDGMALAEDLAQELQCGCCAELVYRPVVVSPCQHFFCGSCCALWIRNGGTNCPACRGISTAVIPSRPLQTVVDVLLRAVPNKVRAERERQQADAIYTAGTVMRIPPPREPSPPPNLNPSDYARPCPHCTPGNPFGYLCPQPIVDPNVDADNAWPLDDGTPPGHLHCGNCENLLATRAPTTTKCDFCQVHFCGINIPTRCVATSIPNQHLHDLTELEDILQSADVYDCFYNNAVEVDLLIEFLQARNLTPRHIYRDIVSSIQNSPLKFKPLFDLDLFSDLYQVGSEPDPDPSAERRRICRMCATEVMLWGLKDWWIRVRALDPNRKDCPNGGQCLRQKDLAHAKEFNHIIASTLSTNSAVASGIVGPAPVASSSQDVPLPPDAGPSSTSSAFAPPSESAAELDATDGDIHMDNIIVDLETAGPVPVPVQEQYTFL